MSFKNVKSFVLWNGTKIIGLMGAIIVGALVDGLVALGVAGLFSLAGAPMWETFKVCFAVLFGLGSINFLIKLVRRTRAEWAEWERMRRTRAVQEMVIDEVRFRNAKRVN